jgi:putative copper export protein/mono/diheme cytochrome c family protein
MDATIVAARTVHFASAMLLFGGLLFVLAVATPVWRHPDDATRGHAPRLVPLALVSAGWILLASFVSGAIWLAVEGAIMSGLPLSEVIANDTVGVILSRTMFGRLWIVRCGLAVALGLLLSAIGRSSGRQLKLSLAVAALAVAAAYLASLAWSGHAGAAQLSGTSVQLVSDILHLLAAGAWLGALPGLVYLLGAAQPHAATAQVVRRFSTLGLVSVAVIVVSGLGNAWYLVGDVPALIGTDYGRMLVVKLALFVMMVAIAAVNRSSLTHRMNARNPSATRALRRNATIEIALGIIIVAIVGALGVMVPAAHQSPVWSFAYTLSWLAAQQSLTIGAMVVAAAIVACVAATVALGGALRKRWRLGMTGLATFATATAMFAWLLAVPAYPTTYAVSPVAYTTGAVVRGARLYAQNCAACHGADGRGDGPAAASLAIMPVDLAAHASSHRVGELFWWIAHGFPGTPMPSFAPRLGDGEIWDLVQFLRAQADAAAATTLTNHAQPWLSAVAAPDFTFELAGQGQESLRQPQGNVITLLVMYTLPQSLPYLNALAAASGGFAQIGLRVIAIPKSAPSSGANVESDAVPHAIAATVDADVDKTYAMFARQDVVADSAAPVEVDYMIDRQGYIRARWIGVPESIAARTADAFDQADLLRRERQRAPLPAGHVH